MDVEKMDAKFYTLKPCRVEQNSLYFYKNCCFGIPNVVRLCANLALVFSTRSSDGEQKHVVFSHFWPQNVVSIFFNPVFLTPCGNTRSSALPPNTPSKRSSDYFITFFVTSRWGGGGCNWCQSWQYKATKLRLLLRVSNQISHWSSSHCLDVHEVGFTSLELFVFLTYNRYIYWRIDIICI